VDALLTDSKSRRANHIMTEQQWNDNTGIPPLANVHGGGVAA
jgi:hypothetical protein